MSMNSYSTREQKECSGGGGSVECDCHEARANAMVRWSKSESSGIKEGHSGEAWLGRV
jgi:hypothetical protein